MRAPALAAALLTFCCASAFAQDEAVPAAPVPSQEQAWGQSPETAFPVSGPAEAEPSPRELKLRAKEIARLERIMAIEGPEFDHEKYARYRAQKAAGAALTGVGAASIVVSVFLGLGLMLSDTNHGDGIGTPPERAVFWGMLAGGITGVAVGAPLLAIGRRGKERQLVLRRKGEILAPIRPIASVSPFSDPRGGGLRLEVVY
jgi:hypothetical protein